MSELLRSVMAECAEIARSGRRTAAFSGCVHGHVGAAMAVPAGQMPTLAALQPGPPMAHDGAAGSGLDAVLPIVLPPPDRGRRPPAERPLPTHCAA